MRTTFKIALLLLMFMTCMGTVNAAEKNRQWTKEMLEYKHDYIVKTTGMSQAQREKFMPIYEAMEKEIFSVYRNAREQSKKVTATNRKVSDEEYANAAKVISEVKSKIREIEIRYFNQFAKILTKKQLFLLKQAELKFTRDMVKKKK